MTSVDSSAPDHPHFYSFLRGGGETGELIRRHDWSATDLGPLETWPQCLRTVTGVVLLSPVPMVLLWGAHGIMIYNDAYSRVAGARHPELLGSEVRKGWPEIADFNDTVMRACLAGDTLSYRDQPFTLLRDGGAEEVWLNLDYSPVLGEYGEPAGVIAVVVETTDSVNTRARLQFESSRLERLFAQAPSLMAMLSGPDHVFELANPAYRQFVGERPLVGLPMREALPEIVRQGFVDRLDEVYRSGQAYASTSAVELLRGPDRTHETRVVDFVFQPIAQSDDEVSGIFIAGYDVTERAHAEERARFLDSLGKATANRVDADSVLEITTTMLGSHMGVALCAYADMDPDEDGFTIRGNWAKPGASGIIGHYNLADFGELAVRNLSSGKPLVLDDVRAQLPAEEADTFLGLGLAATVCLPLVKQGRLTALMAVHDDKPHLWTASEMALVTEVIERSWAHIERVRAETEMRLAEQRFREALETEVAERTAALAQSQAHIRAVSETTHMYQGLIAPDGRLLYMNSTALSGIGARAEEVTGLLFWDTPWFTATPGVPEQVREAVGEVAAGNVVSLDMTVNLPTGVRSFDFAMRPVLGEAGEVVAIVLEAVEITARKRAEQALQHAQKMEALGNLTGGIAHDFNNLLMAIQGSLELLRKRMPDDPSLVRLVNNARSGVERGAALTSRMLSFARKQDLRSEHVDLRTLVAGMAELLERSLGAMVTIETHFAERLPLVETDPNQLESALLNLALNARDAMGGKGRICITARETIVDDVTDTLPGGRYVCLDVRDEGEGMDDATLKRATEPFFTTKGIGKGTGLGLSMVHGFAEQSRGQLVLGSEPGKGTVASLWLPALDVQAEYQPRPATPAEPVPQVAPLTVLTVDDDHLVLMSTADMLREQEHQVLMARSAREALVLLKHIRVDLVITDHAMPHMTGLQLVAEIRRNYPGVAIILASGYAELAAAREIGLTRLSKPFTQAQLDRAIWHATRASSSP
ncbi:PAS domain-containing protein [Halopseudomonas nanhaiensis]|uniref:PAS domain-containing protein n=1 Tax=Halopseudomonas nanhaiensis TaxID=2830842 RepID=UPI001CBC783B|nr:PAS domain-containing protein [Halopseudomonas nanhaiensis]UAW97393.1 PAS domain-containing protein [Halopseudomonas nanhaiensis]